MKVYELNLDGLVGPTHNYAGLSAGNIASINNALSTSNPQAAALQGLEKMRLMHSLGLKQGLLPPQQRPNLQLLYQLGFKGKPEEQINKAYKTAPELLSAAYSASSMWTANTATIAPSTDSEDKKVHFTAANLISNLHRQQEAEFSRTMLEYLFKDAKYFQHHACLPSSTTTADEGAANHSRLCASHAQPGVHLFVYGKQALATDPQTASPKKYPARQTKEAVEALARNHLLNPDKVVFACQNPEAIDQGVFHNDVISVANESVFLVHEDAFCDQKQVLLELQNKADGPLTIIELKRDQLSIQEAVASYLFNSQIVSIPEQNHMILIAPFECKNHPRVKACIDGVLTDESNPIKVVHYLDLKQSMRNGGGPACLRLRVVLNELELKAMHQGVLVDGPLLDKLEAWVRKHYRTQLHAKDLADPQLMHESFQALDELTQILNLQSIYPFQLEKNL